MSNGFIKFPRELLDNQAWKDLPYTYRHVFLTILSNVAFKEQPFTDHGENFTLLPGQFCTTLRQLVKLCDEPDIDKSLVERALIRFKKVGFSRQESRHLKTVITITEPSVCKILENKIETEIETRSRQDRDIKKKEEEGKDKKKKIIKEKISIREFVSLSKDEIDKLFHLHGDSLANQMLDILDAYNTSRQKHYDSDYGAMKLGGWVHKEATQRLKPKVAFNSQGQRDRRTQNADGTYANADYDNRF